MHPPDLASAVDRWAIVRFAVVSSAAFIAWLLAFERWVEPLLRRWAGAILGREILWVPVGVASFRIWGLPGAETSAMAAEVAVLGMVVVLVSAAIPVVLVRVAARWMANDALISSITYLMALPMMMSFVLRVLSRGATADKP